MSDPSRASFRELPLALILEPDKASRSEISDKGLDSLAADILRVGLINPIAVFPDGDLFRIAAGHRRFLAHQRAGLAMILCRVYATEAVALEAIQFSENAEREELSPADEAIWFSELLDKYPEEGTTGVAARLRISRDRFEARLNLLAGDVEVFRALQSGEITIGVATELNKVTSEHFRRMFLGQAVEGGATVAVVSGWVRHYRNVLAPATNDGAALDTSTAAPAPLAPEYFTCVICGKESDTINMRSIMVHRYCEQASLGAALQMYDERRLYLRAPRTVAEAAAVIAQLVEQFPSLLPQDSPRV